MTVESVLAAHPEWKSAHVVGVTKALGGDRVVDCVFLRAALSGYLKRKVIAWWIEDGPLDSDPVPAIAFLAPKWRKAK